MTDPQLAVQPSDDPRNTLPRLPWPPLYLTALIEGISVIIIEIAGARAIAPFFGTSLQVWTSQITVTLLFLALGYALGGLLAKQNHAGAERSGTPRSAAPGRSLINPWTLPTLFTVAGTCLSLYPFMRTPLLEFTSQQFGVAIGSLTSAAGLFGIPLLMLGAVSPVLIAYLDRRKPGAGSAAGRLFFTNTMGGLAGGWITAMILIPYCSLRVSLVMTGMILIAMGVLWAALGRSRVTPVVAIVLLATISAFAIDRPPHAYTTTNGTHFNLLYSHHTGIGLLQVLDFPDHRQLRIDGVDQGDMLNATGSYAWNDYVHNLALLSLSHHPTAKTALQLGLGAGMIPKMLAARGIHVTVAEIEPRMFHLARDYFSLPDSVDVHTSDARAFLRHDKKKYDLVILDTFAGDACPWHMLTHEAMLEMRARLNPNGRLLINTVAWAGRDKPGLDGIESAVLSVFPMAILYPEPAGSPDYLINVSIVAGENLRPQYIVPPGEDAMAMLEHLIQDSRPATARIPVPTDDHNRLDYEQAPIRVFWRTRIWAELNSTLLWD